MLLLCVSSNTLGTAGDDTQQGNQRVVRSDPQSQGNTNVTSTLEYINSEVQRITNVREKKRLATIPPTT